MRAIIGIILIITFACTSGKKKTVYRISEAKRVKIDESILVITEPPIKIAVLNDSMLVTASRNIIAAYHIKNGLLSAVFDIRKCNTDSVLFDYYKTQPAAHTYFSVRNDTSSGLPITPVIKTMTASDGVIWISCYAPIGYKQPLDETISKHAKANEISIPAEKTPTSPIVSVIDNRIIILGLNSKLKVVQSYIATGADEMQNGEDYICDPASGFFKMHSTIYAPALIPDGISDLKKNYTEKDSALLFAAFQLRNKRISPIKKLLATHEIDGYKQPLYTRFQIKHFQQWDDTVFVNDAFGFYTLPGAKPYRFQFSDTAGESRHRSFARYENAIAYLATRKNPSDTTQKQNIVRVVDLNSAKLLYRTPMEQGRDITSNNNHFYIVSRDEEYYYINTLEAQ